MTAFTLTLMDCRGAERFGGVDQLVAADVSGSFGVLAHHEKMVAVLRYGLARFLDAGTWRYVALPGGVLRFAENELTIVTVRYFLGEDRAAIVDQLAAEMSRADSEVRRVEATLAEVEQSLIRRLGELGGTGGRGGVSWPSATS
jgi:F-type H+-transporting ATPase subunit epsilon